MLRITVSKGGKAAVNYFRDALAQQDYFSEKGQVMGQWQGKLASKMGLGKEVTAQAFEMMVSNRNPITGEKITPRDSAKRRAGYDFTFNAAKSISLVYAITKDEEILEAHREAIKKAMLAVEKDMQTQVGQGKQKRYATTGNLVYANFEHHTSRPVAQEIDGSTQYLADPHLHSHCFVMNATWNENKARYQAIEVGTIKKNAIYYEALYHSYLADNLQKAGYQVERSKLGIEIAGIERSTIEKFSNRTLEIEQAAKEKGIHWEKDKAKLGAKTRHRKVEGLGKEALEQAWKNRLTLEERFNIHSLKGAYAQNGLAVEKEKDVLSPSKAIDLALQHYMERKSAVPEKQVLGYAMKLSLGQQPPKAIEMELRERQGDSVFTGAKNSDTYLTTKETLLAERGMKNFAVSTRGQFVPLNPEYEIQQDFLNEGQRNAIQHTLQSSDQVIMISGAAGVGKTTLMKEVKEGIEASNKKLFAFAPSAAASRGVLRSKSFEGADTIKKLLDDNKLQAQLKDQVILIDEAGMVGTKTMNGIFQIAKEQNARVVLSGDFRQHQSVESGDAQRLLEQESGLPVARVNEIVRQTDQSKYRAAVKSLAEGDYNQGFEKLDRMDSIIEIEDQDKRHQQIAKDYLASIQAPPKKERGGKTTPRTAIVVSPTHAEGKAITSAIRDKLKAEGLVDQEERTFQVLRKLSFTETEKQDALNYQKGMSIQFHKNYQNFKAGHSYDVQEISKSGDVRISNNDNQEAVSLPFSASKFYQVCQKEKVSVAKGDLIRITGNGKSRDGSALNNGDNYKIKGFNKEGDIELDNGKTVSKDYKQFTLGYYSTSHSSQGKDATEVLIAQSSTSFPASNQKQFYVSVSRGVERCRIYTDDKEALKWAASQEADRMSAEEVLDAKTKAPTLSPPLLKNYQKQLSTPSIQTNDKDFNYERHPSFLPAERGSDFQIEW